MNIDKISLVNAFEEYLDIENPTGSLDRTGDNARTASTLLSFLNQYNP